MKLSLPNVLLRFEGLVLFVTALIIYGSSEYSWWLFAALILVPDLGMLGYLFNAKVGSITYNLFHTYAFPLAAIVSFGAAHFYPSEIVPYLLVWIAHIGIDRLFGFGLKYSTRFRDTHLQRI